MKGGLAHTSPSNHASPTGLRAYKSSCILACVPTSLRDYKPSCLQASVPTSLRAFVPSCLRACVPTSLRAYKPSLLRAYVPTCPRAFKPSCRQGGEQGRIHDCVDPRKSAECLRRVCPDPHNVRTTRDNTNSVDLVSRTSVLTYTNMLGFSFDFVWPLLL